MRKVQHSSVHTATREDDRFQQAQLGRGSDPFLVPKDPTERAESPRGHINEEINLCINVAVICHKATQLGKGVNN